MGGVGPGGKIIIFQYSTDLIFIESLEISNFHNINEILYNHMLLDLNILHENSHVFCGLNILKYVINTIRDNIHNIIITVFLKGTP